MPEHANASQRPSRRSSALAQMLIYAVTAGVVLTVAVAVVAMIVDDLAAGMSALAGGALSVVIFGLGVIAIRGVLAGPTASTMAGAFGVLIIQLFLTAGALFGLLNVSSIDLLIVGVTFVAVGLVFQVGALVGYRRARIAVVEPTAGQGVS